MSRDDEVMQALYEELDHLKLSERTNRRVAIDEAIAGGKALRSEDFGPARQRYKNAVRILEKESRDTSARPREVMVRLIHDIESGRIGDNNAER